MDTDLFLVLGVGIAVLALPAIIGAFSESRPPRAAAIMVMIGGGLIVLAVSQHPGGYSLREVPDALTRVIGRYF
ncbi:hypothetical protein [Celeribacter sp.]|uniref:hypothetical protein n=1 Tax=Celeribacter sp. TaxID=1890673 RepID=UPI003A9410B6